MSSEILAEEQRGRGEQRKALTPSSVVLGALHPVSGCPTLECLGSGLPCSVPPSSAYFTFFSGASGTVSTYGPLLLQLAILAQQPLSRMYHPRVP